MGKYKSNQQLKCLYQNTIKSAYMQKQYMSFDKNGYRNGSTNDWVFVYELSGCGLESHCCQ